MTTRRTPTSDPFLVAWFEDGPTAMPDRVLDVVADRIGRQRQRRSWRLLGRLPMNTQLKLAAGLAAVLVLAVVGYNLLPRSATGPGGQPSPSPTTNATSAAPSPTAPQCEDLIAGCAGVLQAGSHTTSNFEPTFTYTTPAGWINTIDVPTLMALSTSFEEPDSILVWSKIVPADRGADCVLKAKSGASASVEGWITYLTTHPGLVVSNQRETTLNGLRSVVLDLRSSETWDTPCADDAPSRNVPIIRNIGNTPGDGYGTAQGGRVRLYVVDAGAETVLITIYSYAGDDPAFQAMLPQVEPLVQTFTFGIAPTDTGLTPSQPSS